jgi:hypothetical protein
VATATGLGLGDLVDIDAGTVADFAPGDPAERELADLSDIRIPG